MGDIHAVAAAAKVETLALLVKQGEAAASEVVIADPLPRLADTTYVHPRRGKGVQRRADSVTDSPILVKAKQLQKIYCCGCDIHILLLGAKAIFHSPRGNTSHTWQIRHPADRIMFFCLDKSNKTWRSIDDAVKYGSHESVQKTT